MKPSDMQFSTLQHDLFSTNLKMVLRLLGDERHE